jgi:hypothetical protein
VITKMPSGNVTRSSAKSGGPKRSARHHSAIARYGVRAIATSTPPLVPYRSAPSTTTKISAYRVGLPYWYEKSTAYATSTPVSNSSAHTGSRTSGRDVRLARKMAIAPAVKTAVTNHAHAS